MFAIQRQRGVDFTFDAAQGPNFTVNTLALQTDGKVVLGGTLETMNAQDHNYIARLNGNLPPAVSQEVVATIWHAAEITWFSVLDAQYQIQWALDANAATWNNLGAPVAGTGSAMSVFDATRNGARKFYRVNKL